MTPDELRRIDALIDQHVFGHKVWWAGGEPLRPPVGGFPPAARNSARIPTYTTSWDAAGQVVERLQLAVIPDASGGWRAGQEPYEGPHWYEVNVHDWEWAQTAPLAICLAALETVGVDVTAVAAVER